MPDQEKSILKGSEFLILRERANRDLRIDRNWTRPCIYVHYRNESCLYVGRSTRGWLRLFRGYHRTVQANDKIEFFWVEKEYMKIYEEMLIWRLNPKDNKIRGRTRFAAGLVYD